MFNKSIVLLVFVMISVVLASDTDSTKEKEDVVLKVYYEAQCPFAKRFISSFEFRDTIYSMGSYMDIKLYPYGSAETKENNGTLEFICQHGPLECYGNKLHACAIDVVKNASQSALYNSCLMGIKPGPGSNDAAADKCGKSMQIDSEPIKECAASSKGSELLKYYGEETNKAYGMYFIPYVTVNGVESNRKNIRRDVCKALSHLEGTATLLYCSSFRFE